MKWINIIQAILNLSPEVLNLVGAILGAVKAAPPEHQTAVANAMAAAVAKHSTPEA